jgi:hypothetical protein
VTPPPKKKLSRAQLQKELAVDLNAAFDKCFAARSVNPLDPDVNRRVFRALVATGSSRLLALGIHPQFIAEQAVAAVLSSANASSFTVPLFGPLPPASA